MVMHGTAAVVVADRGPNVAVRALWFLFVGLWLGWVATVVGYLLCLTVVGLPLGLAILNRLPAIMTLRSPTGAAILAPGVVGVGYGVRQRSFLLRALWYMLVGWWLGAFAVIGAWLLVAVWPITLGLSLAGAFWLFDRVPAILTLRRS